MTLLNIDPKKRVELMLRSIASNFTTAADAIRDGDEAKMQNWLKCGVECLDPLIRSIEMLHPKEESITKKIQENTGN